MAATLSQVKFLPSRAPFKRICLCAIYCLHILSALLAKSNGKSPIGHGMELGKHRVSDGHIEQLDEVPAPEIFWEKFAKTRTPALFKGAAKDFPAFSLWTDEFLSERFGDLRVKLEAKQEKGETPIGEEGMGHDTIRNYLRHYRYKNAYIVSQLPDPMAQDINVLSCLSCGTFAERILEANLWLSSGGTSSLLHRDADNAINCLLNGTKDWILIDPRHEDKIPIAEGDEGYGGFATLDVNSVNLKMYPNFQQVPWQYANVSAGDCLFLPYGYWHQVRSYGSKNMAVSVLFSRMKDFSATGCNNTEYVPVSLANAGLVWTYPGYGPQTLGNADPFELIDILIEIFSDLQRRNAKVDLSTVYTMFVEHELVRDDQNGKNLVELIYNKLNVTHGGITTEKIKNLSTEVLKSLATHLTSDPANSAEYEHTVLSREDVRKLIEQTVDENPRNLTQEIFFRAYKSIGSERTAREIFLDIDEDKDGIVSRSEVTQNINKVLKKFEKEDKPDPSSDYYAEQLEKDRRMMKEEKHDEF